MSFNKRRVLKELKAGGRHFNGGRPRAAAFPDQIEVIEPGSMQNLVRGAAAIAAKLFLLQGSEITRMDFSPAMGAASRRCVLLHLCEGCKGGFSGHVGSMEAADESDQRDRALF
jgi:hypothetical protein